MQIVHDVRSGHYSCKVCYYAETNNIPSIHTKTKHGYNDKKSLQHHKEDSRKGDFVNLTEPDKQELEIDFSDEEIKSISKWRFKKKLN